LSEDSPNPMRDARILSCQEVKPLLMFYVCDELGAEERGAVEAHVAACEACAAELRDERAVQEIVADLPRPADRLDPAGALLSQCRSELAEALDDMQSRQALGARRSLGWLRRGMALHPAWSAALLLLMGVGLGVAGLEWASSKATDGGDNTVSVRATPRLSEQDLAKMAVAGISLTPSASANGQDAVQVRLRAERPVVVSGSLDDDDVRRVLTYVVEHGQRFDPGVRLDCLDALRSRAADTEVRRALVTAVRRDQNPAVRLKALEALRDASADESVRDAYLGALMEDTNPGVRVEAVNSLVRSIESRAPRSPGSLVNPEDQRVLRALEDLTRKDPNNYVRLQSAAALRELAPRELQ
jgi:anti-sigma factor RsiW